MKKVLFVICVVALIVLGIILYNNATSFMPFYGEVGKIYCSTEEDSYTFIKFDSKNKMTMTVVNTAKEKGQTYHYGFMVELNYSGEYYNDLVGNIHFTPKGSPYAFWSKLRFYDGSEETRAYLKLEVLDAKRLLVDSISDSFKSGEVYYEDLAISNNGITLDGVYHHEASEEEKVLYNEIALWFSLYGA